MRFPNWMRGSLKPDELIGEHQMRRGWILPPTSSFVVYLHRHEHDDPRFVHDHPADNLSILLRGELVEYTPALSFVAWLDRHVIVSHAPDSHHRCYFRDGRPLLTSRSLGCFTFRLAEDAHRLEVKSGAAWTVWIRFRNRRKWGFFEPAGWRLARTRSQPEAVKPVSATE